MHDGLSIGGNFGGTPLSPPSPSPTLAALAWPLGIRDYIFLSRDNSRQPGDQQFSLWRFRSESPPNPAPCISINQSKSGENPSTPTGILHESESKLPLLRKSRATQSHPQATPKPVDSQLIGTPKPPQGHSKATPRPPQGHLKARARKPTVFPGLWP